MTSRTRSGQPGSPLRRYPCCATCGKPVHAAFYGWRHARYGWRHARRRSDEAACADSPPTKVILSAKIIRIEA